jgi:hypothetical protein
MSSPIRYALRVLDDRIMNKTQVAPDLRWRRGNGSHFPPGLRGANGVSTCKYQGVLRATFKTHTPRSGCGFRVMQLLEDDFR